jgi:DNA-binding NarL/FixJ family response regulator
VIHRVLLVDDYEPWRRQIAAMLERGSPRWEVVGEASDGLDAVEKACTLRPDLTLLDIGLPALNGIEAAARILARHPTSRILFVSEHSAPDIVDAALATGAGGYLVKSRASVELRPAMSAVVEGGRFLSAILAEATWRHAAAFCADEARLLDEYVRLAETTLTAGHALIVTVETARRDVLQRQLQMKGVDVDRAIKEGRYLSGSVADALSGFMVDGWPDEARFQAAATPVVLAAARASNGERRRVAALGECGLALWRSGKAEAAIRAEQLWDELVRRHDIEALCGFSTSGLPHDEDQRTFQRICATHSAVRTR